MSTFEMNRRDFLWRTSILSVSGLSLFKYAQGRDLKYVVAETVFGKIRGVEGRGIKIFKGIPYGGSTEGANRFMPPVDPAKWAGVRDALEYGYSAPQSVPKKQTDQPNTLTAPPVKPVAVPAPELPPGPSIYRALAVPGAKPTGEGEDCLVLNVWTPGINDGGKRPVMLWLHGGGFRGGSGSNPGWDGTNLCIRGNVVVITINHRLNVMGFANFSEFSADFAASGQAGMLDIVHALKWVKSNIAQFGGDANRVMVFGQSGGGRKCETLLAMPSAKGLFHRAVIESGIAMKVVDKTVAVKNAEALLGKLNISKANIHEIQKLPLGQIIEAHYAVNHDLGDVDLDTTGFSPSLDDTVIPQHPFYPSASPIAAGVPIIIGHTRTEYTGLTTDPALWHLDGQGLQTRIKSLLGSGSEAMISLYKKHNPNASPTDIFFLIESDYRYGATSMKIAERRAALAKGPVYLYYFAWESPVQDGQLKSPHNIEWPFAFDNVGLCANLTGGGPEAIALAEKVSSAWIAFAHTGNPNTAKLPYWPAFTEKNRETMIFNNESKVENDPLKEQRTAMFQVLGLS